MRNFFSLFKFDPSKVLCVGVERERFLVNESGDPVPESESVLNLLPKDNTFGYELSACQLEDRVGPVRLSDLLFGLRVNDLAIESALNKLGLKQAFYEVADENMDLTVFNDPTGRYQEIVKTMPRPVLLTACRLAGTHVHIGMPDLKTALQVYNEVIPKCDDLCASIDNSNGERLSLYREMVPGYQPIPYASLEHFYDDAVECGFDKDPRKNWQLIRITIHGTIEFRMGGTTASHDEVFRFATACHDLCEDALHSVSRHRVSVAN